MKIIDLLNKIAKGEEVPKKIKYEDDIYIHIGEYCYYCDDTNLILSDRMFAEQKKLNENIEIIEEVEDKGYEDIDYADNLEQGEYIDYANDYEVKFDIVKNRRLINALIRNQKYILGVLNDNNKDSR